MRVAGEMESTAAARNPIPGKAASPSPPVSKIKITRGISLLAVPASSFIKA